MSDKEFQGKNRMIRNKGIPCKYCDHEMKNITGFIRDMSKYQCPNCHTTARRCWRSGNIDWRPSTKGIQLYDKRFKVENMREILEFENELSEKLKRIKYIDCDNNMLEGDELPPTPKIEREEILDEFIDFFGEPMTQKEIDGLWRLQQLNDQYGRLLYVTKVEDRDKNEIN